MRYLIVTDDWNEKIGGAVCLHKLCHIINELGGSAYIIKSIDQPDLLKRGFLKALSDFSRYKIRLACVKKLKTNPDFNTPIYMHNVKDLQNDGWVVIYPEVVYGNPLRAKNVVRWFLHNPTFHTGVFSYSSNDVAVRFNTAIKPINIFGLKPYDKFLKVVDYPLSLYNMSGIMNERTGSAYCIRKGLGKKIIHDLSDSILIDNLSHDDVAKVFKKTKVFYSYDTYTAYSLFAILCGCKSVVIPDKNVGINDWYPDERDRFGIYYGDDYFGQDIPNTELAIKRVYDEVAASEASVASFIEFSSEYFN
ncbi:hypothetical protein DFR26_0580 [Paraperlucidibaca baekdonensis]|uniref:WavQ n=1 Tax=Paraperlucidibaca baekdonensis TaxID=748120 RepID=A0A3E0H9L1_9GAMM|nr:WavQ [Paraperlucidibaca baekdonensis]REH40379.1 hypothetical protein DFR26_0580 [Paraperlucidibaca baekdonensis]